MVPLYWAWTLTDWGRDSSRSEGHYAARHAFKRDAILRVLYSATERYILVSLKVFFAHVIAVF